MLEHKLCEICHRFDAQHLVSLGFDELVICQDCFVNKVLQEPLE